MKIPLYIKCKLKVYSPNFLFHLKNAKTKSQIGSLAS